MNNIPYVTVAVLCVALTGCSGEDVTVNTNGGASLGASQPLGSSTTAPAQTQGATTNDVEASEPALTAPVAPVSPLAPVAPLAPVSPNATDSGGTTLIPTAASAANTATYRITFDADWTAVRHPVQYPTAVAHFSDLIGAVHNEQVIFFEPGQIATDGVEFMAETGGTLLFSTEINESIQNGSALSLIEGSGINNGTGQASVEVNVTLDYPQITITSKITPSPDWFVGLHNFALHDGVSFIDGAIVDAIAYDSGTDSGVTYTSIDADTQPRDPIAPTTSEPQDSSFVNGLPSAGQFIIERL